MALAQKHYSLFKSTILFNSNHFNHDLVSTTYSELQSKKNIPDLIDKISWLSNSEILHKAPPRLITTATETSLTGPKKPNNKIREQQPPWYVVWKHDNMDNRLVDEIHTKKNNSDNKTVRPKIQFNTMTQSRLKLFSEFEINWCVDSPVYLNSLIILSVCHTKPHWY